MSNARRIPGEFHIHATSGKMHVTFCQPLATKAVLLIMLLIFTGLWLSHLRLLLTSTYFALRGNLSQALLSLTYGTGQLFGTVLLIATFVALFFVVHSLLWLLLGKRELIATRDSLIIQQTLLGKNKRVAFLADDIHYFNQFTISDEYGDAWQLEAVTSRKPFKLYSHSKRYPVDWLGSTLADFYSAEFRMIGPSRKRSARLSSVL